MQLLVDRGVPVDISNESGSTAMHMACSFKQLDVVKWLAEHGASLTITDYKGHTPLSKCKGTLGEELRLTFFPLHCAVKQTLLSGDHTQLTQVLDSLHQDEVTPNPVMVIDDSNHTPLMMAALANNPDLVNLLLDHPLYKALPIASSLNSCDQVGHTALSLCAQNDAAEMVALLCRRGASLSVAVYKNPICSILRFACRKNAYDAAEQLCLHGAEVSEEHKASESTRLIDSRGMTIPVEVESRLVQAYRWSRRKAFMMFLVSSKLLDRAGGTGKDLRCLKFDELGAACLSLGSFTREEVEGWSRWDRVRFIAQHERMRPTAPPATPSSSHSSSRSTAQADVLNIEVFQRLIISFL